MSTNSPKKGDNPLECIHLNGAKRKYTVINFGYFE